jgi:prolipoprotein diacylglyceryltransferase
VYSIGLAAIISGVIGARLGFVLVNLSLYVSISPWTEALRSAFSLAPGTEIGWMGVLLAAAVVMLLIRRWQVPPLALLDAFAPAAAIMILFIGLANLLSGDMAGMPTSLPWGIWLWGMKRHPTQILLMLAGVVILIILWRLGGLKGAGNRSDALDARPSFYAQIVLIMLAVAILLIEPLRADSPVVFDGIRTWQVIGLTGLLIGLSGFMLTAPQHLYSGNSTHEP